MANIVGTPDHLFCQDATYITLVLQVLAAKIAKNRKENCNIEQLEIFSITSK